MPDTVSTVALHPWNTRLHLGRPHRAVLDADRGTGRAVRRARLRRRARTCSTPTWSPRVARRDRRLRARDGRVPRVARRRAHVDRGDRRDHVLDPPRRALAAAARRERAPDDRRHLRATSSAPTSTSTGTRPSTRSRRSRAASRGTRTTATRSSSRSSTSRSGSRSPTRPCDNGCPSVAPGSTAAARSRTPTSSRSAGSACTTRGDRRRRGPGGWRGRVLVAHAAPHRTEHDRRGAQGLHPPVRADGAEVLRGDPQPSPPHRANPCDAPERQYPVLVGGRPAWAVDAARERHRRA